MSYKSKSEHHVLLGLQYYPGHTTSDILGVTKKVYIGRRKSAVTSLKINIFNRFNCQKNLVVDLKGLLNLVLLLATTKIMPFSVS